MGDPRLRYERINIGPFTRSNMDDIPEYNKDNMMWSRDIIFNDLGWPTSRPGYDNVTTSTHANFPSSGLTRGWMYNPSGTYIGMVTDGKKFYYNTTGAPFVAMTTEHDPTWGNAVHVTAVKFNNVMYFSPHYDATGYEGYSFDGSSWTALTELSAAGGSGYYRARTSAVVHERIFVANIYETTTHYPYRIRWSNPDTATTWTDTDYIDLPPDDGGEIMAIVPYQNSILIFREEAVYVLTGRSSDSFTIYKLTDEYGSHSEQQIVKKNDKIYFYHYREGLVMFDGESFEKQTFSNGQTISIAYSSREEVTVAKFADAYDAGNFIIVTKDGFAYSYCLNVSNGLMSKWWREWGFSIEGIGSYKDNLYLVDAPFSDEADLKRVWRLDASRLDDGANIMNRIQTDFIRSESGQPFRVISLEFDIHLDWQDGGNVDNHYCDIDAYLDGTFDNYDTRSIAISAFDSNFSDNWHRVYVPFEFGESTNQHNPGGRGRGVNSIMFMWKVDTTPPGSRNVDLFGIANIVLTIEVMDEVKQREVISMEYKVI